MRIKMAGMAVLVVTGATLGAAMSGGLVPSAPAGAPSSQPPLKYYDPLP